MTPRVSPLIRRALPALALMALLAPPVLALDDEGEEEHEHENEIHVIQFLASTGVDVDAEAKAKWEEETDDGETEREFKVEVRDLDGEGPFHLFVDDVDRGAFSPHEDKLKIKFESGEDGESEHGGEGEGGEEEGEEDDGGAGGEHQPLDFDPLGAVLEVRDAVGTVYFSDTFQPGGEAASGESGKPKKKKSVKFQITMANGSFGADPETTDGPDLDAKGKVSYQDKKEELRFEVEAEHLDPHDYELVVGGDLVAAFTVLASHHEVKLRFEDPFETGDDGGDSGEGEGAGEDDEELELKQELTFDPLGKTVEIVRADGVLVLSAVLPETPAASDVKPPKRAGKDLGRKKADKLLIYLVNVGTLPGAKGEVILEIRDDGEHEIDVEIEDVPDSTYGLCIGGADVAEIEVGDGHGHVELSSDPGPGDVDLGVLDIRGALVEIKAGDDVILSVVFPASVPEALAKSKGDKAKFDKGTGLKISLRRVMTNVATDLDAIGDANWRYKSKGDRESLDLRMADLPDGAYELFVDGAPVSPSPVLFDVVNGKARLKFDSVKAKPPKVLLLDFEVFGHDLKIGAPGDPSGPGVLIVTID